VLASVTVDRDDTPAVASDRHGGGWAVLITGLALFMASLDNLVVTTALPVIRVRLHAGLSGLEWTVNAYTLTFAVLLLTAAAFGEREDGDADGEHSTATKALAEGRGRQ
jgi:MFS family permease